MKVTLKDIAKKANCSVAVASSVLNNGVGNIRYSKEVALKVKNVASLLNYSRSLNLEKTQPGWVGLAVHGDTKNPLESTFINKFTSLLDEQECETCILPLREEELSNRLQRLSESGITLSAIAILHYSKHFEMLDYIKDVGIPYLFLNSGPVTDSNCIIMDEAGGCTQAIRFLKTCACEKILFITSRISSYWSDIRLKTTLSECEKLSIKVSDAIDIKDATNDRLLDEIKNKGVNAIVTNSSNLAAEIIITLAREGVKVPEDVGLIALDDYTSKWEIQDTILTHMSLPIERMAEIATMRILKMIRSGNHRFENILLPEHLLIGNTCTARNK